MPDDLRAHKLHLTCMDEEPFLHWSRNMSFGIVNGDFRVVDKGVVQVVHVFDLYTESAHDQYTE